jgi:hypothetical protein
VSETAGLTPNPGLLPTVRRSLVSGSERASARSRALTLARPRTARPAAPSTGRRSRSRHCQLDVRPVDPAPRVAEALRVTRTTPDGTAPAPTGGAARLWPLARRKKLPAAGALRRPGADRGGHCLRARRARLRRLPCARLGGPDVVVGGFSANSVGGPGRAPGPPQSPRHPAPRRARRRGAEPEERRCESDC